MITGISPSLISKNYFSDVLSNENYAIMNYYNDVELYKLMIDNLSNLSTNIFCSAFVFITSAGIYTFRLDVLGIHNNDTYSKMFILMC